MDRTALVMMQNKDKQVASSSEFSSGDNSGLFGNLSRNQSGRQAAKTMQMDRTVIKGDSSDGHMRVTGAFGEETIDNAD